MFTLQRVLPPYVLNQREANRIAIVRCVGLHIYVAIYSDIGTIVRIPTLRTRTSRIPRMRDAEVAPYRYSRDKLRCTYCHRRDYVLA